MTATSTIDPARVTAAKALVVDVLGGVANATKRPEVQADDMLLFAVELLERVDPGWLEQKLKDARFSPDNRTTVGLELRGPLRKPLLTALGVPPFVIG